MARGRRADFSLSLVFVLDCLSLAAGLFATTLMAVRVSISSSSISSIALAEPFVVPLVSTLLSDWLFAFLTF